MRPAADADVRLASGWPSPGRRSRCAASDQCRPRWSSRRWAPPWELSVCSHIRDVLRIAAAAGFCTALVMVPLAGRLWAARASPLVGLAARHAGMTLELTTTGDPRPLAATASRARHGWRCRPTRPPVRCSSSHRPRSGATCCRSSGCGWPGRSHRPWTAHWRAPRCSPTGRRSCSAGRRGGSAPPGRCGPACAARPTCSPARNAGCCPAWSTATPPVSTRCSGSDSASPA